MLNRQNGEFKQSFRPQNSLLENTFRPFGELAVAGIKSVFRGILPICKVLIQKKRAVVSALFCTPAGARTLDTLIKSQVLYQLSYKRIALSFLFVFCTPAGARTLDTLIKSQVLYQLSYKRIALSFLFVFCTPAGARTLDTLIKSQVLYQLSYKRIALSFRFCGCKGRNYFLFGQMFCRLF